MNKSTIILSALLVSSTAVNIITLTSQSKQHIPSIAAETKVIKNIVQIDEKDNRDDEISLLKKKLSDLSNQLTEKNATIDNLENDNSQRVSRNRNPLEGLKKISEENPELFKKIRERMDAMNSTIKSEASSRRNFFNSINTANLNDEQKAKLAELTKKSLKIEELTSKMEETESFEEQNLLRMEIMRESFTSAPLLEDARNIAIDSLATDLGYKDSSKDQFSNYMKTLIDSTSPVSPTMIRNFSPVKH